MARTVFVLGAGASRKAGGPLMDDFLDRAEDLLRRGGLKDQSDTDAFKLVFRAMANLQPVYAKASLMPNNIESVFASFEMAHLLGRLGDLPVRELARLERAMGRVIVATLEDEIGFPTDEHSHVVAPPPYDEFLQLLTAIEQSKDRGAVSVITFNYDLCFEFACNCRGRCVDYGLREDRSSSCIPYLKLHGSMNWGYHKPSKRVVPWHMEQYRDKFSWPSVEPHSKVQLNLARHLDQFVPKGLDGPVEPEPVIVPPTWAKTQHFARLSPVWRMAAQHLSEADTIIVIGYSLPPTDEFFRYLYALGTVSETRLRHFWIVNPDDKGDVEERFRQLLGPLAQDRFQVLRTSFSDSISPMANQLRVSW